MQISTLIKIMFSMFIMFFLVTSCERKKQTKPARTDHTAEIKKLTIEGDNYYYRAEFEKAIASYERILLLSDTVKNRVDYVDALIGLGYVYQYRGEYIRSEETAIKALPHLKYMTKPRFAWSIYSILGFNYFKNNDPENALNHFRKALNLNTSSWRKWLTLNNMGIVYMKEKQYKKAVYIFNKLTTEGYYAEKYKTNSLDELDLKDYATMVNNLGICYYYLKDPKAIDFYHQALKIRIKNKDRENIGSSYTSISEYYLESNPKLAKKYAEIGYKKASEVNMYSDQKYCLSFLVKSSEGNDLKKYSNLYLHFIDSVHTNRLKQKNQFSNIKYNSKKDREENLFLKTQKAENELQFERQKNRSYISYVIILLTVFILLFLIFYINTNGKREKNQAIFKSEMRISNKLHQELNSDIYETLQFANNSDLNNIKNKEKLLNALSNIYSKTRNISKENSKIPTDTRYMLVLKEMISEYKTSNVNIILSGFDFIPWDIIEKNKKIILYRIIQELLFNMKKYNNSSMVSIVLKFNDKKLSVLYTENSNETVANYFILEKRLQNVENRIKTIKGTINFDTTLEKAFKINFTFPI